MTWLKHERERLDGLIPRKGLGWFVQRWRQEA